MAHATDYPSRPPERVSKRQRAVAQVRQFLENNPGWPEEQQRVYCLKYYADLGVTQEIFNNELSKLKRRER